MEVGSLRSLRFAFKSHRQDLEDCLRISELSSRFFFLGKLGGERPDGAKLPPLGHLQIPLFNIRLNPLTQIA
jgi:hypothetical protein